MPPFDLENVGGLDLGNQIPFLDVVIRLCFSAVLASAVAYRPWRLFLPKTSSPNVETAQAQIIIAVAGSVMVIIIGDSVARAFGLVGLGAFIRFRSGIKDPRDAAVMFVMIGVGMAVGLGLLTLAILTTVFVSGVLSVLDATGRSSPRRLRVGIDFEGAEASAPVPVLPVFPGMRILETPSAGSGAGKMVIEIDATEGMDAAVILDRLREQGLAGVRTVSVTEGKDRG